MMKQSSQNIANTNNAAWNRVAIEYERRVEPFTSSFVAEMIAPFQAKQGRNKLLDVGCGSGMGSYIAAQAGFDVTASDWSPAMVDRVHERFSDINSVVADGQNLPFDNEFDYAVGAFSVIFFPSPVLGLEQMRKCLVDGGKVCMSAWGNEAETPAFRVFPDAIQATFPDFAHSTKPRRLTGSRDSLSQLLHDAGFEDIRVEGPIERKLEVPSAEEFYYRFSKTSPNVMGMLDTLDEEQEKTLRKKVMELATERSCRDDCISIPSGCYFAYGTKPGKQ
jgi:SAM-dependent methyltransferase